MVEFSVHSDWMDLYGRLTDIERRQLPFAAAKALTGTAKAARTMWRADLPSIFDRPSAYTLNATFVQPATKNDLRATIGIIDRPNSKGRAATKYLAAEVLGGNRRLQGFERRICAAARIPPMYMSPARGVRVDRHGNIPQKQIGEIIDDLAARPRGGKGAGKVKIGGYFIGIPRLCRVAKMGLRGDS